MTELTDLIGLHTLDAVDFETRQIAAWEGSDVMEDSNCCRFRLDGVVYACVEDPDDGYRSSMRSLDVSNDAIKNSFPAIQVLGRHRVNGRYSGVDDVLELIDVSTGKVVLEVGTENTDDYYPSFVAHFDPAAMSTNQTQP